MEKVYVVGVGMTATGRFLDETIKSLTERSVNAALADAELAVKDIQAAWYSNTTQGHMAGQNFIRGEIALRTMGFEGIPMINVENACASGSTALHGAVQGIRSGMADIAIAVGAEKMVSQDRAKMFSIFDSGWDIETVEDTKAGLLGLGEGVEVPEGTTSAAPYSVFMDVYAAFARFHMGMFGTTQEQIAAVSAKNHQHSVHNELAQFRKAYSIEEVLSAPPITYPLTLPMCAPISDGSGAVVVCSERALRRMSRSRAVPLLASVIRTGSDREAADVERHITRLAALEAYQQAGVGPEEVSFAEVHDATAVGEIIQIENLGLCKMGEGGPTSLAGATTLGGRVPVNPSGGLESKGHPIGATGLMQIHELVLQLRGEAGLRQVDNARIGIAENGGGLYGIEEAVCCVTVLGR